MKCEKCGKNIATTHIKSIVNGKVSSLKLCEYCAALNGLSQLNNSLFGDLFSTDKNTGTTDMACSSCGTKLSEIVASGLLGCADCYKAFNKELSTAIKRVHGRTMYSGKIPQTSAPRLYDTSLISKLKKEMAEAVDTENFERAAELRDKIKEIEAKK